MTLWRKVGTLFRASAHEPLEQLVDANALRIMEQELRDTEHAMLLAKRELAGLMATIKQLQRSNEQLRTDLAQRFFTFLSCKNFPLFSSYLNGCLNKK